MGAQPPVTRSSRDGSVTLGVRPGGDLASLVLAPSAEGMPAHRLAEIILATYREAADAAAGTVPAPPAAGADAETVRLVRGSLPAEPGETPAEGGAGGSRGRTVFAAQAGDLAAEQPPPPPPPRPSRTPAPRRTRRRPPGGPDGRDGDERTGGAPNRPAGR
ncbi:hypothetical protein CFN78_04705 [Amycolatopsis antarctica]|uniref:Uncharacterized protein n=1 Tax=Amycolatopsis antarctica TaxID=1854586 RepID=A0A263DAB0_9PSEU|nr:hypothetical protein CFN78_04705 [Amycolatopsis antarctica]